MISEKLSQALEEAKKNKDFLEISDVFLVKLIQSALSFDNPSLKEEDVVKVLKGNVVGVNPDKVRNILNQKNAFLKVWNMAKEKQELDENTLKDLHQLLCEGNPEEIGGLYRRVNISVKGSNHTPCSYEKVYDRMDKYFIFMQDGPKGDLWEYISYLHLQLAKIHPFLDGNGRLARLVLNYELMKYGFMPIIITSDQKDKYFSTLEAFKVEKDIKPFMDFLEELELASINTY